MWSDNETTEDLLGFQIHADLITDVLKDDKVLPITIGVFGDWGSGKSSIIKMIQKSLSALDDGTFVLYFNGWIFEGYDDAKAALLESIVRAFEENTRVSAKIKDETKKLLKSINWMRVLGLGFKNVVLPTAGAYLTGGLSLIPFLVQKLSSLNPDELTAKLKGSNPEEYLKSIIKEEELENDTMIVREFREEFSQMIDKSEIKKLVVLIDDLDRCTPERIIENLEAIKLFLNVPKTAFVIGADPRIVKHAIEFRYNTNLENANDRIVEDYLEKLIQVPYYLPKLSDSEVETYLSLLVAQSTIDDQEYSKLVTDLSKFREKNRYSVYGLSNMKLVLKEEYYEKLQIYIGNIPTLSNIISKSLYGNPRQIKRFLNTFTLRNRLAQIIGLKEFDNSILVKLMILEYSEPILFNQLFQWQMIQEGSPKEIKELEMITQSESGEKISTDLIEMKYAGWNKEKVIQWLQSEPLLNSKDLRDYFWISRDKLTSQIPGQSLIPPYIREIFNDLNQELTLSIAQKLIKEKVLSLQPGEKQIFIELSSSMLKKNPGSKNIYQIFHCLIDENIEGAPEALLSVLENINHKNLEVSFGSIFSQYKQHPIIGASLIKYFEKGKSPAANAFKLEEE